jgi:outer membrane protein TolC
MECEMKSLVRNDKTNRESEFLDMQAEISRRAYELYTERGYQDGHELEDWLQAEAELMQSTHGKAA